jgi:hypothetical protein
MFRCLPITQSPYHPIFVLSVPASPYHSTIFSHFPYFPNSLIRFLIFHTPYLAGEWVPEKSETWGRVRFLKEKRSERIENRYLLSAL